MDDTEHNSPRFWRFERAVLNAGAAILFAFGVFSAARARLFEAGGCIALALVFIACAQLDRRPRG